jgi:hypothetical protein
MNKPFNVDTERIVTQLQAYRDTFVRHPLFTAARNGDARRGVTQPRDSLIARVRVSPLARAAIQP